eukprot:3208405-Rhodomonas_salina.2
MECSHMHSVLFLFLMYRAGGAACITISSSFFSERKVKLCFAVAESSSSIHKPIALFRTARKLDNLVSSMVGAANASASRDRVSCSDENWGVE